MIRKPLDIKPGKKSIKIRAARLYSDLLSPPSAFAIFAFIIAWEKLPFWKGMLHASIFGMLTSLMPLGYILFQLKRGELSDIHISNPDERIEMIFALSAGRFAMFWRHPPCLSRGRSQGNRTHKKQGSGPGSWRIWRPYSLYLR